MQQLQSSEQDKWVKLARAVVALSVLVWIVMVAILLLAPSPSQCPDWHLKNAHSTSLWILLLGLGGPLNAFGCLIAVRWNQPVQRVTRNEADTHSLAMPAPLLLGPPERLELCGRPNSLVLSFDQMYPVLRAWRLGRGSVSRGLAGTTRKQNLRWPRWLIAS